jgi:hypothetical protein
MPSPSQPGAQEKAVTLTRPSSLVGEESAGEDRQAIALPRAGAWKGVVRIAAFFGLVLALIVAIHFMIETGFGRIRTSDFGVSNRIVGGRINTEIVISGSSRALVHYDPRIVHQITGNSAYNIGRNGSQTDIQLALLKTYLAHNRKPRLVVHNLDLFSFVTSHQIYDPAQYIPYLYEDPIYSDVKRVYPNAWKWKYIPLYGYVVEDMRFTWVTGLKGFFNVQPPEDHFDGFVPRRQSWTGGKRIRMASHLKSRSRVFGT